MWITLLAMAVAVSLEPFRIGMTVLMINRPRPLLQLLAFLAGGFAMGIAVGVIVLFVLRPALGFAHFTLPKVQIVVGAVLLVNAALVATGCGGAQARRSNRGPSRPQIGTARDGDPACARRPVAVDGGRRGPGHRAAVRRLSRCAWRSSSPPAPRPPPSSARWCCSTWWRSRSWRSRCSATWWPRTAPAPRCRHCTAGCGHAVAGGRHLVGCGRLRIARRGCCRSASRHW